MKHLSGTMTVEAAVIFPLLFLICICFIQFALYFLTMEYAKSVCNQGLLIAEKCDDVEEREIQEYIEKTILDSGLIETVQNVEVSATNYLIMKRMEIMVSGSYSLLFPMDFRVSAVGYLEDPVNFCNMTDLIWESASKVDVIREFIEKWG